MVLSCYSEPDYDWAGDTAEKKADTSTTTVRYIYISRYLDICITIYIYISISARRGLMYDVSVATTLAPSLPHQTVFR